MKRFALLVALLALVACKLSAHPMPASVMLLDVREHGIEAELQWPLKELQLVFPGESVDSAYNTLIQRKGQWLNNYLIKHFSITDSLGHNWQVTINNKSIADSEQSATGRYHELIFYLWLQPPAGISPRHFIMHYDAIMHQLVTHKMFIKVIHDWYGGLIAKDSLEADLGVLGVNTVDGTVPPVVINLDEGSAWKGFSSMVVLGIHHIAEGTDHLLFLIVLLLPATLMVEHKRWSRFGGTRYSVIRLLKFITAFTAGHSVSLFFGAMHWLTLPQQPVEVAIAFTILITAVHAIYPLFFRKEVFIAAGFGLIHGLAFATVLSNLNIHVGEMIISILGFNIGIELMQLFVIICVVPWLIILSKNNFYRWLRIGGAGCAIAASLAWILERIKNEPNYISNLAQQISDDGKWLILALVFLSAISVAVRNNNKMRTI